MLTALLTIAPTIVLCIFIYKKDRSEKEPIGLLMLLLFMGVLSIIPSTIFELGIEEILNTCFAGLLDFTEEMTECITPADYLYQFLNAFVGVALVEEFFKWVFMLWATKNSKHFNSLFDGIVYAAFVSLGFAVFENIIYVISEGIGVAILRMFLSVPAHMFFAVFMGFYYSLWNVNRKSNLYKNQLAAKHNYHDGSPDPFPTKKYLVLSLLVPVLIHGLYDFLLFTSNILCILVFIGVMIFLYIYCFKKINKLSRSDRSDMELARAAVYEKYPDLAAMEMRSESENSFAQL